MNQKFTQIGFNLDKLLYNSKSERMEINLSSNLKSVMFNHKVVLNRQT